MLPSQLHLRDRVAEWVQHPLLSNSRATFDGILLSLSFRYRFYASNAIPDPASDIERKLGVSHKPDSVFHAAAEPGNHANARRWVSLLRIWSRAGDFLSHGLLRCG